MPASTTLTLDGDLAGRLAEVPAAAGVGQILGPDRRSLVIGRPSHLRRWAASHLGAGKRRPGTRPLTDLRPVARTLEVTVTTSGFHQRLVFERLMARYEWMDDKVHRRKMAREAARSVLPNATEVKIVVSANLRAWRTMLELRLGEGAELEIRRMAVACLRILQQEAPALFADFEIYQSAEGGEAGRVGFHKV